MERLKFVLIIAAIVATAHASPGQQLPVDSPEHPSASPTKLSYVVIGDVRNFNYFPLSGRTTVQQAVLTAGLLSDSVSVSVIRASQDRSLWTQMISSTSGDSHEPVMNGDILAVQSLLPVIEPVQKNAALRTDAGVIVVALADEAIAVGDVLLQTSNQSTPGQQVKFCSRFRGYTTGAIASLADPVVHGDVLTASRRNRFGLTGPGGLAPAFSEWHDPVSAIPIPAPLPENGQLQNNAPGILPDERSPGFSMEIPGSFSESGGHSEESVFSQENPLDAVSESGADIPLPVQSVSQVNLTSYSNGTEAAPQPPLEESDIAAPITAAAGEFSPWNLVFIGGLLIAGTLILAGSLRADEEIRTVKSHSKDQQQTPKDASTLTENLISDDNANRTIGTDIRLQQSPLQASPVAGNFADVVNLASDMAIQEVARTKVTPSNLVSPNEWFDRDWLDSQLKPGTAQSVIRKPAAELVTQLISGEAVVAAKQPITPVPETCQQSLRLQEKLTTDTPAFSCRQPETIAVTEAPPVVGIPESSGAGSPQQGRGFGSDEASATVQTTGFEDLEDLLQNRLPIDICVTRLPLRIALFGRPAGPRRLRIDAAHSALPAPHSSRPTNRQCEEAVTISESPTVGERQLSEAIGSLDRALHHLQERTNP